jgi:hypothetical protein
MLTDLLARIPAALRDEVNYSGIGASQGVFVRNLSQTKRADPEIDAAAIRAASNVRKDGWILQKESLDTMCVNHVLAG